MATILNRVIASEAHTRSLGEDPRHTLHQDLQDAHSKLRQALPVGRRADAPCALCGQARADHGDATGPDG